jgi:ABC-type Zn2+ transport system substrate-binding protein/surface adhesin
VQEANSIELILESPAINIVGFEHNPTNQEEKRLVDKALETLHKGEQLFVFSPSAQCAQTAIEIESELAEHSTHDEQEETGHKDHEDGHEDHEGEHEGHSDFAIHYQFNCNEPSSLKTLELQFFKLFPLTEEIDAQIVTDKRQFAAELSAQQPSITF